MCEYGSHECAGVRCPNGGVCHDLPGTGTTKCICRTGFFGPHCQEIKDACHTDGGPCAHDAECLPLALGRFKCKCRPGWSGPTCEHNIDDCAGSPCALNATCTDLINDFHCECPKGFSGKRCNVKEELCGGEACVHGLCVDRLTHHECVCESGWRGDRCEVNVDECAEKPCRNGATCIDLVDGYKCHCVDGFFGSRCQNAVDLCKSSPCENGGVCSSSGVSFSCECPLGFDGPTCGENVDECVHAKCTQQGTEKCVDGVDSYECVCRKGWEGKMCDVKTDMCGGSPCLNDGLCTDKGDSFTCECREGWKGERCEVESGACEAKPCKNEGICLNLASDYMCVCPEGVSGRNCEHAPDRCIGSPCAHGGICTDVGSKAECSCPKGRHGTGCQFMERGCPQCENGGHCKDGEETCHCPPGYTGARCEVDVDECAVTACPASARCVDAINAAYCVCPSNVTGVNCDKVVDVNYDLSFSPDASPSRATRALPSPTSSPFTALSLSLWLSFTHSHSTGTLLSLYNSSSPVMSSSLREMLTVNESGVSFSLIPSHPPSTMRWPSDIRVDDGQWHHLVFIWSSSTATVSIIVDSVKVFSQTGYADSDPHAANLFLSLGASLSSPPRAAFEGSLTRVTVWDRALNFQSHVPSLFADCQGAQEVEEGLLVRFVDFSVLSGRVERVAASDCVREEKEEKEEETVIVTENCPSDLTAEASHSTGAIVTWTEPSFVIIGRQGRDTLHRPLSVRKSSRPGEHFTMGEHEVIYIATDEKGRSVHCTFKVSVVHSICPSLAHPVNGVQTCEQWGVNNKYRACSIHCSDGYAFSTPPSSFYTCAADGRWRPSSSNSSFALFRYPQCTRHVPATRMVSLSLNFPAVSQCTVAGRDTLRDTVVHTVNTLNNRWNFCNIKDESGACVGVKADVVCETLALLLRRYKKHLNDEHDLTHIYREKRQDTSLQQVFRLSLDVPVKRETVYDEKSGRMVNVVDVLEDAILYQKALNLEKMLPNGRPDLHTLHIRDTFHCNGGSVLLKDLCVPCSPGTFFHDSSCLPCSIGHFQPSQGKSECRVCPRGTTTVSTSSIVEDECKLSCQPGHFLDLSSPSKCKECPFGFYQPSNGSFHCVPCAYGKSTLSTGSTSEAECRDECGDGEQLTVDGCSSCPRGTYRRREVQQRCTACPSGTTTAGVGSTRREDCDTPTCNIGQFLVPESKQCQVCPRGTYQDEGEQLSCKLCPTEHTTAQQGATSSTQCYSTNQCETGEDNCSWHALCIDLPDDFDHPRFECRCKPGYRGNGTHCYDACHALCMNDGVCKKNAIGYAECVCKESFTGDRCEHRYEPKGQKAALITATLGAVVAVLIVIVIVIFMISFRTNRVIDSAEKNMRVGGEGHASLHRRNNFIVGPMDSVRPVGYYYEEDDEYDMKAMYIGGGSGGVTPAITEGRQRTSQTSSSSSTMALSQHNADMEHRRRLAQQHMYIPQRRDNEQGEHTLKGREPSRSKQSTSTNEEERSPL